MNIKQLITLSTAIFSSISFAAQTVTLEDGRQVQLNDNFTWQYLQPANTSEKPDTVKPTPVVAAPVISTQRATTLRIGDNKPTLQLSDSGVDVVLGVAQYKDGKLILPTAITNQSSQSVINIELKLELLDNEGKHIASQESVIWQSIKRMAETYLRPKSTTEGKTIEIAAPQADSYQLIATISQVETR